MTEKWKLYNNMIVPTGEPHINIEIEKKTINELWKKYPRAILIRYTSNWDKQEESEWYYIIKDKATELSELGKSARNQVRKGLKNFEIRKIDLDANYDAIYEVYVRACERYDSYHVRTKDDYYSFIKSQYIEDVDIWGGFNIESGELMGYSICSTYRDSVDWNEATFVPDALKLRISDAMEYFLLDYYINQKRYRYIISGQRSIDHVTNVQEYDIRQFGFRKAYCDLNIIYRPIVELMVSILYPFRNSIRKLGNQNVTLHKLSSIMLLEEIRRKD